MCDFMGCIEGEDPIGNDVPSSSIKPIDPKPSHGLPSRSQSEPVHHNAPRAGADELLEDWPRRVSDCSTISRDWRSMHKTPQPRVTISASSSMQLYHIDPIYAQTKSYSKEDCQGFSRESMMEAVRIKKLVLSSTPPGASTKESFKHLLKNDVILSEEIRGIEHLILCKSASKLLQERRDHARAVVSMQHRIDTLARDRSKPTKMGGDLAETLATFSASRSSRSTKAARIRASRAA